jgi:hypothetical protein
LEFFGCPKEHGGDEFFIKKMVLHAAPPFWQSNFLNFHPTYPHYRMATKNDGAYAIILVEKKIIPHFPILVDKRILVTIQWCGCVRWRPKFFSCHLMVGICQMAINFFQLPKRT